MPIPRILPVGPVKVARPLTAPFPPVAEAIAVQAAFAIQNAQLYAEVRISQGQFWTVSDLSIVVERWYAVTYQGVSSYRRLLHECGLSQQQTERQYRSRADEQTVADFMRRLGTLSFFRTVDLDETSQVTQDGAKVKKFVIRAQVDYGDAPAEPPSPPAPQKAPAKKPAKGGA